MPWRPLWQEATYFDPLSTGTHSWCHTRKVVAEKTGTSGTTDFQTQMEVDNPPLFSNSGAHGDWLPLFSMPGLFYIQRAPVNSSTTLWQWFPFSKA